MVSRTFMLFVQYSLISMGCVCGGGNGGRGVDLNSYQRSLCGGNTDFVIVEPRNMY